MILLGLSTDKLIKVCGNFLNSFTDSYLPKLEQVRDIIINDILVSNQSQSTAKYLEKLREEYDVEILSDFNAESN